MAKKKINTLPVADPTQLKNYNKYQQAVTAGRGNQFLKRHPVFKQRAGAVATPKNPADRYNDNMSTGDLVGAEPDVVKSQAQQAGNLQNLEEKTDYTGTSTRTELDPATGRYIQKTTLSPEQQEAYNRGMGLTTTGMGLAQEGLNQYQRFGMTGSPEERARIEEETYKRLTRNVDRDQQQEFDAMEQRMYNRGIPLDPSNPAYKREMDALNEKYNTIKENASQNAVAMGGQELGRDFTMGLQSHQQGMSDIGTLQQQGLGFQAPNEVGFNAPQLNQSNPTDTALKNKSINTQKAIAELQAKTALAGMGGGEEEESPI
jgi:hypothetical protein